MKRALLPLVALAVLVALVGLVLLLLGRGTVPIPALPSPPADAAEARGADPQAPSVPTDPAGRRPPEVDSTDDGSQQDAGEASLTVTVLSEAGTPLADVYVDVHRRTEHGASGWDAPLTDAEGRTTLGELPPGLVTMLVQDTRHGRARQEVELRAGERTEVQLRLELGLRIAGVVVYEDGEPCAGATVELDGPTPSHEVTTPADGTFSIAGLSDGLYRVEVFVRGRMLQPPRVSVAAGTAELRFVVPAGLAVSGRVLDLEGELTPATVTIRHVVHAGGGSSQRRMGFPAEEGLFRIDGMPPGEITLSAQRAPMAPSEEVVLELVDGMVEQEVVLQLREPVTLSGRVVDPLGVGIPDVTVRARHEDQQCAGRSTADGSFVVVGLAPGTPYTLEHSCHGWLAVDAGDPTYPGGTEGIVLTMTSGGGIAGRVTDASGEILRGARVALASLEKRGQREWWRSPRVRARPQQTADGYRYEGLPPGTYRLSASLQGWIVRDEPIVEIVADGVEEGVDLVMELGGIVSGLVLGPADEPLEGAQVWADLQTGNRGVHGFGRTHTDAEGRFVIGGLRKEARIVLHASADGMCARPGQRMPVAVKIGDEVTVRLAPLGTIVGRVEVVAPAVAESYEVALLGMDPGGFAGGDDEIVSMTVPGTGSSFVLPLQEDAVSAVALRVSAPGCVPVRRPLPGLDLHGTNDMGTIQLFAGGALEVDLVGPAGEPIEHATVQATTAGGAGVEGSEAGAGRHVLEGLDPGPTVVKALHEDYVRVVSEVIVPARGAPEPLTLRMSRGGRVHGTVLRADGTPFAEIRVLANHADPELVKAVTAGADGSYSISGLAPGSYRISARDGSDSRISFSRDVELPPRADVQVDLGGGQACTLTGTVIGWQELVGSEGAIRAETVEGEPMRVLLVGNVSPDGEFSLPGLPPGRYELRFGGLEPTSVDVPRAASHHVELNLSSAVLRGIVRRADGGRVDERLRVTVTPIAQPGTRHRCTVTPGGRFSRALLPPGEYEVFATLGGVGVATQGGIHLDVGDVREDLELLLAASGELSLTIEPETRDLSARMWRRTGGRLERSGSRDGRGPWTFLDVQPGEYRVAALVDWQVRAWRDVVVGLEPVEVTLSLRPAGQPVELRLLRGGEPARPDRVELHAGGEFIDAIARHAAGNATLRPAAGDYTIVVWSAGERTVTPITTDASEAPLVVEIDLPR